MEKVKLGIIGLGGIAQGVHLPILSKLENVQILAVCDTDKTKAKMLAEKYNVPYFYTDYEKMLYEVDEIEAVEVLTPTNLHAEMVIAGVSSGKDVFVERPLARSYKEAESVVKVIEEKQRKVMVGMNLRFRPDCMLMKGFIEQGELGSVFYVKAGWFKRPNDKKWVLMKDKAGGGVMLDLGISILDLALWMAGYPEVRSVNAICYKHQTKQVEDSAIVFVKFKNDSTLFIDVSWSYEFENPIFYLHIFGTEGTGELNPFRIYKDIQGKLINLAPEKMDKPEVLYWKSYENELKHFIGAVKGLHPLISSAKDALYRNKIVDAIYKSAEKRKEIVLK
ncbi:Gfo/Idh/MocA family protein [Candidatus Chrysopegis kryptomonas]|jgi:predicted dehydrogenase|uniref:Predicted dehydrogenase n=1 Tax=Candidatus Chryseopegocella kryptomonas TaxID=1633643 RepID=A0A0N7MVY2_9BACT|nr:Gfo/Idh/MocA family oxidoreductase [Candidatus Chrysopegis kryptomonas]CUS97115.1 Predicted dehydrogenase [Candidatus Chrysopegis kryptomonas]